MVRCFVVVTFLVAILNTSVFAAGPAGYAKPELLIETEELAAELQRLAARPPVQRTGRITEEEMAELGRGELTLVDVRALELHKQGTIGDALHVEAREWAAAFGAGEGNAEDNEAWRRRINRVLFRGPKSTVVVFDNATTPTAMRVWWILKYWGVEDVRVLNGGLRAWEATGEKRSLAPLRAIGPANKPLQPDASRLAKAGFVKQVALAKPPTVMLLDARTPAEFQAGAIPNAGNVDWQSLVDPKTGKLRNAYQLRVWFRAKGVDLDKPIVCYCRSGARSSVLAFALELMGAERVANYYGSWNEWSRLPDAPIARPVARIAQ